MATTLKLRRGTTSQHGSFTGAESEITYDTDKKTAVMHDGATAGGIELARADLDNVTVEVVTEAMIGNNVAAGNFVRFGHELAAGTSQNTGGSGWQKRVFNTTDRNQSWFTRNTSGGDANTVSLDVDTYYFIANFFFYAPSSANIKMRVHDMNSDTTLHLGQPKNQSAGERHIYTFMGNFTAPSSNKIAFQAYHASSVSGGWGFATAIGSTVERYAEVMLWKH